MAWLNEITEVAEERSDDAVKTTSLDPIDWTEFRCLAHAMLDSSLNQLRNRRDEPVWTPPTEDVAEAFQDSLPLEPQGTDRVCRDISRFVQSFGTGNTHPRFFGWVHGTGTPGGVIAELVSAALNANCGGRNHVGHHVENQVIDWWRQIFQFPETSSGLLVSGTSMATQIALTVARNEALPFDVREEGVVEQGRESGLDLIAYTSEEAHGSVDKAMETLGLGRKRLRRIKADANGRMDPPELAKSISADRQNGLTPFAVIATAGTVNLGAVDQLDEIADIAERENVWLHVDGAFGALAVLSPQDRHKVRGIERAHSLAFDFHKWLHVPYDAGMVLVRDRECHLSAFGMEQDYLAGTDRGLAAGQPWFCSYGPELSRGFRALKVWFTMKEHGLERLGRKIADNCRQAEWLAEKIDDHRNLELLAPVALNIVCFRFIDKGLAEPEFDQINNDIVVTLQESGIAVPSTTRLGGRLAIRVNITNHRTTTADLEILISSILRIGKKRAADCRA